MTYTRRHLLAATGGVVLLGFEWAGAGGPLKAGAMSQNKRIAPEDFGAVGNGYADDTAALNSAFAEGKPVQLQPGIYLRDGSAITSLITLALSGPSMIKSETNNTSGLELRPSSAPMDGVLIENVNFTHPKSPEFASGTMDNWAALKLVGQKNAVIRNVGVAGDVGLSIGYGARGFGDRQCYNVTALDIHSMSPLTGMGIEIFGVITGDFSGHFEGGDGSGGRARMHGLRYTGYEFAVNRNVRSKIHAMRMANGVSFQQYTTATENIIVAVDCTNAVQIHGIAERKNSTSVSRFNRTSIFAECCDYTIYDGGGNDNVYEIDSTDCDFGVYARGNSELGRRNAFRGSIRNFAGRGFYSNQADAHLDLTLEGRSTTDTDFGVLLSSGAEGTRGMVRVSRCAVGVRINCNNVKLTITAVECDTGVIIAGNSNDIDVRTDCGVVISGANNIIKGQATGAIRNMGSNNNIVGLNAIAPVFRS